MASPGRKWRGSFCRRSAAALAFSFTAFTVHPCLNGLNDPSAPLRGYAKKEMAVEDRKRPTFPSRTRKICFSGCAALIQISHAGIASGPANNGRRSLAGN